MENYGYAVGVTVLLGMLLLIWVSFHFGWTLHKQWNKKHTVNRAALVHVGYTGLRVDGTMTMDPGLDLRKYGPHSRKVYLLIEDE